MENWGDPWADDADNAHSKRPPAAAEVETKPRPSPSFAAAPVRLDAFLDDAQWGSFDQAEDSGGFGEWATRTDDAEPGAAGIVSEPAYVADALPAAIPLTMDADGWGAPEEEIGEGKDKDTGISETSDSGTTIHPDEIATDALHPDDDVSTRPSTSPSDASHTEPPIESPRTSFEDERLAGKAVGSAAPLVHEDEAVETAAEESNAAEIDLDDEFAAPELAPGPEKESAEAGFKAELNQHKTSTSAPAGTVTGPETDPSLMKQLFPPINTSKELPEAPEDPIYSASTRKVWYRLTRKQTMREFNSGGDDNNYIRVNWVNSQIKSEASKIVARWATEDRISGRGPSGRHSFYWDQPAESEHKAPNPHTRKSSITSIPSAIQPTKQRAQPLTTDVHVAFSWSSPVAHHDGLKQEKTGTRSTSSPFAAKSIDSSRARQPENRSVSVDMSSHDQPWRSHKQTHSLITPLYERENPFSAPVSDVVKPSVDADPWGDLSTLDTIPDYKPKDAMPTDTITTASVSHAATFPEDVDPWGDFDSVPVSKSTDTTADDDDDNDWGDMVGETIESSAVSTPPPVEPPVQTLFRPEIPSTSPTSVRTAKSSHSQTPPFKHAAQIVRLKGMVSPTSAIFGVNSFLPMTVEQTPMGPGLLKPVNKKVRPVLEDLETAPISTSISGETLNEDVEEPPNLPQVDVEESKQTDDIPTFDPSTPETPPTTNLPIPEPLAPEQDIAQPSAADPWSDADFSIFESAPAPPLLSSTTPPIPNLCDQGSISKPHTTPKAEHVEISAPKLPLTGATNSAQSRKAEEDETIRGIVEGLPDLSYMLMQ